MNVTGVSRETLERLSVYANLLEKWQTKINLVGPSTMPDLWRRHMLDSAQLFPHLPSPDCTIVDLGSGAGFPGMVLAIMGASDVHLIESNIKKVAFLREVARATGTKVTVHNKRIEDIAWSLSADVVCSRACANLTFLLGWAQEILRSDGFCLFHKGQYVDRELTESQKKWNMSVTRLESLTDPNGVILRVTEISRCP